VNKKILYSIGDSFIYRGPKYTTWSSMLADKLNYIDANNGTAGSSNDRTFRSVIRDISRVETEGKLWTEFTGDIDCKLKDLFIVVGWTNPFRFDWYNDGEFFSTRYWKKSTFLQKSNPRLDFKFSDEITLPFIEPTNTLIRFFNQIISLKNMLENKKIKNVFYNCFFPFGENTVEYFESIIDEINANKLKELIGFDNPSTYYSLMPLWKQVPDDYKKYNQLEYITMDNIDETLHPVGDGNKMWSDFLFNVIERKYSYTSRSMFPSTSRDLPYQTFGGEIGVRDMEYRFEIMNFPDSFEGKTVLDIGCNAGVVCIEAKKRGAKRVVGIDNNEGYIEVAKEISNDLDLDIEYYVGDINVELDHLKGIIGNEKFDYVFALAVWGHIDKGKFAGAVNYYTKEICWFEGHAFGFDHNTDWPGDSEANLRNWFRTHLNYKEIEHIGLTSDRSHRHNFKLIYKLQ